MPQPNTKFTLETHYRVFDDDNGQHLTVRPDTDGLGCVQLYAEDSEKEYWGDVHLVVPPGMARQLAVALNRVADDLDKQTP